MLSSKQSIQEGIPFTYHLTNLPEAIDKSWGIIVCELKVQCNLIKLAFCHNLAELVGTWVIARVVGLVVPEVFPQPTRACCNQQPHTKPTNKFFVIERFPTLSCDCSRCRNHAIIKQPNGRKQMKKKHPFKIFLQVTNHSQSLHHFLSESQHHTDQSHPIPMSALDTNL